jgi:hypothetical protein
MKKLIIIFLLLFNFSCTYTPTGPALTELNKEFDLKFGRKAVVGEEGLYITFKDVVEDSRCPVGYMCFWEGNGAVLLIIEKRNNGILIDTLNTTLEPHALNYLNYKISLKKLKPYPVADSLILKKNYIVTLFVEKYPVR